VVSFGGSALWTPQLTNGWSRKWFDTLLKDDFYEDQVVAD
jgi:hypothetical protein